MAGPFFGNMNNQTGGLGYQPPLQSWSANTLPNQAMQGIQQFKPNAKMAISGQSVGYGSSATANSLNQKFLPQGQGAGSFNPYSMAANTLGNIGGGQRANIGDNVWETGGRLSGTAVGNAADKLGGAVSGMGQVGAIVGLGLKGAADISNLIGYDPEVTDIDTGDQLRREGGPILQIGDKVGSAGGIKKEGDKMTGQGALAGAKAGAAIGMIWGPIGAAIGGAVGAGAGALLGNRKKQRAYDAYAEAMGEIDETTAEFNRMNITSAQQEYGEQRRSQRMSRERNPYLVGYNSPFTV